jgi:dihydrofolate reductase
MKPFKAIAAMSLNHVIGAGNQIPWHLPEDFKWFKQMTTGRVIVMGRKTFESVGKPLPNRETIVLSRAGFAYPGVQVVRDLAELVELAKLSSSGASNNRSMNLSAPSPLPSPPLKVGEGVSAEQGTCAHGQRDIFICGGAQVYAQALPLCSDLYLTLVKRNVAGDAFFPPFEDQFEMAEEIRDTPEFKILHYQHRTR